MPISFLKAAERRSLRDHEEELSARVAATAYKPRPGRLACTKCGRAINFNNKARLCRFCAAAAARRSVRGPRGNAR